MRDRVTVLAPAKLNLALDVVGILPGGYHALDMTMQAISLYERVVIRRSPYLDLALPGSNVKPGPGNTAIKAALAFFHYTGLLAGADITIYKSVPVRAGMAGGSADAAAVLVGLNELYGARLSMSELCALGVSIGADVPFALMGGTCRVQGLGDLIKALPPMPECWFTVVMPDYGVSTPEAFAAYDKVGSSVHPDCAAQEAAIRAGDLDAVCAAAGNALEECSGAKDNEAIKAALRENGAVTALMTGSGAAVFGVFRTEAEAKAAGEAAAKGAVKSSEAYSKSLALGAVMTGINDASKSTVKSMQSMTSQSVNVIKQMTNLLNATNSLLKDLEDIADVFDEYKGLPQDFTAEGKKLTELANAAFTMDRKHSLSTA